MPLSLSCQTCGAELLASPELRTADCPYCRSPSVIERPPSADRLAPTFALGFEVPRDGAFARVAGWLSTRSLFARSDFKRAALGDLRGVYLPAYLFSAAATSSFRAEIGERYSEEEKAEGVENGKPTTRTRTIQKTEWRPLEGRCAQYVADLVVTASKGLSNEELERIEPFDLGALRRYQPALVSGWIAEEPTLTPAQGLELGRQEAMARVAASLERFMPGDEHRGLEFETTLANEVVEPCLLPVWIAALRYHAKRPVARVLVNGQTGEVFGRVPISWLKVAAAALGVLGVLAALALFLQRS
jgi:DNA-directed RNA polymerase subunit RPC12/RpoP